jgi:hypothetical protein
MIWILLIFGPLSCFFWGSFVGANAPKRRGGRRVHQASFIPLSCGSAIVGGLILTIPTIFAFFLGNPGFLVELLVGFCSVFAWCAGVHVGITRYRIE